MSKIAHAFCNIKEYAGNPSLKNRSMYLTKTHKQSDLQHHNDDKPEVMFMVSNKPALILNLGEYSDKAIEVLEYKVTRNPLYLRSHVQRIYLYRKIKNGEALYGALLDLFIALNTKGFEIRQRLLFESKCCLDSHHFNVLYQRLGNGINAASVLPLSQYSRLSKGLIGTINLLINNHQATHEARDPQVEAHEYLEYGEVDEARNILEVAVLKEPWRKELHIDLLEIYKVSRDADNCDAMYRRLADKFIPDHHAWIQTAKHIHLATGDIDG
ncbi:MAG: hypothetical protein L3J98_11670 [Gammaproteobacteria bacterium]|nr:hypothetical protein [Gammaproteobacteria bacterium]MCF6260796.1 hypothetical protein [Gammaproteobacteria bacterium]